MRKLVQIPDISKIAWKLTSGNKIRTFGSLTSILRSDEGAGDRRFRLLGREALPRPPQSRPLRSSICPADQRPLLPPSAYRRRRSRARLRRRHRLPVPPSRQLRLPRHLPRRRFRRALVPRSFQILKGKHIQTYVQLHIYSSF